MNNLDDAVGSILTAQRESGKPLAVVLAGHNGSGKSTMWYMRLAPSLQIPLVNADRMFMSVLPEVSSKNALPAWASSLRDGDLGWMQTAQQGVECFVRHAAQKKLPFAMETVFSQWQENPDGSVASKIQKINELQASGYFVLLFFVGLASYQVSIGRVMSRVQAGGHNVPVKKLKERFPRTQKAIKAAAPIADATIMVDNSRSQNVAFTVCRIQMGNNVSYDIRSISRNAAYKKPILAWLDKVCDF